MMPDLNNPAPLISGVLISAIGTGLFIYGKKQLEFVPTLAGIALCIIPFVITSVLVMWLATGACLGGVYYVRKAM